MAKKTKYLIINGNAPEGSLSADDITLAEFTDEEYERYAERSFDRDVTPDLLIELDEMLHVIKKTKKPVTFAELFDED